MIAVLCSRVLRGIITDAVRQQLKCFSASNTNTPTPGGKLEKHVTRHGLVMAERRQEGAEDVAHF